MMLTHHSILIHILRQREIFRRRKDLRRMKNNAQRSYTCFNIVKTDSICVRTKYMRRANIFMLYLSPLFYRMLVNTFLRQAQNWAGNYSWETTETGSNGDENDERKGLIEFRRKLIWMKIPCKFSNVREQIQKKKRIFCASTYVSMRSNRPNWCAKLTIHWSNGKRMKWKIANEWTTEQKRK